MPHTVIKLLLIYSEALCLKAHYYPLIMLIMGDEKFFLTWRFGQFIKIILEVQPNISSIYTLARKSPRWFVLTKAMELHCICPDEIVHELSGCEYTSISSYILLSWECL